VQMSQNKYGADLEGYMLKGLELVDLSLAHNAEGIHYQRLLSNYHS